MYPEVSTGSTKPYLCLTEEQLPELKDWKVGESYVLVSVVTLKEQAVMENKQIRGEFCIESVVAGKKDYTKKISDLNE